MKVKKGSGNVEFLFLLEGCACQRKEQGSPPEMLVDITA